MSVITVLAAAGVAIADDTIHVIKPNGSGHRVLRSTAVEQIESISWAPDSKRIAFGGPKAIRAVRPNGTGLQRLRSKGRGTQGGPYFHSVDWSPDGQRLTFSGAEVGFAVGILDLRTGAVSKIPRRDGFAVSQPSWSPDGSRLAVLSGNREQPTEGGLTTILPDGSDRRTVLRLEAFGYESYIEAHEWSPDGTRIAFATNGYSDADDDGVYVVGVDGTGLRRVGPKYPNDNVADVSWSPNGSRIAYTLIREGGDVFSGGLKAGVFVVDDDGSSRRKLISYPGTRELDWSPDGSLIAFSALESSARLGSRADNVLRGTSRRDVICGLAGDDVLIGAGGRDRLYGDGCPAKRARGARGNDVIRARDGRRDWIDCGPGGGDRAIVDRRDRVRRCETVSRG